MTVKLGQLGMTNLAFEATTFFVIHFVSFASDCAVSFVTFKTGNDHGKHQGQRAESLLNMPSIEPLMGGQQIIISPFNDATFGVSLLFAPTTIQISTTAKPGASDNVFKMQRLDEAKLKKFAID